MSPVPRLLDATGPVSLTKSVTGPFTGRGITLLARDGISLQSPVLVRSPSFVFHFRLSYVKINGNTNQVTSVLLSLSGITSQVSLYCPQRPCPYAPNNKLYRRQIFLRKDTTEECSSSERHKEVSIHYY